jgi:hypothetical protein
MNILDGFFKLGDKATGGDPVKKALFDYLLMWIVFIALSSLFVSNLINFIKHMAWNSLFSSMIFMVFIWFNYYALKAMRQMYITMSSKTKSKVEDTIETANKMLEGFKK